MSSESHVWPAVWGTDIMHSQARVPQPLFTPSATGNSSYVNFFKHLYWSIIALQWCVSFCFITKWISCTYTYISISPPSCVSLPPSLSHPSSGYKAPSWSPCAMQLLPTSYFTFGSVYMSVPLSLPPSLPSPPSLCLQVHSLRLRLYSCPAPRFFITIFF